VVFVLHGAEEICRGTQQRGWLGAVS